MATENRTAPLIATKRRFARSASHAYDELHSFRSWLRWMCVDQSNGWTATLSWFVFIISTFIIPGFSHFYLACRDCDNRHARPYEGLVQLSLSGIATLSFVSLSQFVRIYGVRRFLFFDKLCDESETVRNGYTAQVNRSLKILFIFVAPSFAAESAYKIWWYSSGATAIPFFGRSVIVSDTAACILELGSWLYRTIVFFLVCVLFRLVCYLQILRLQDFARVFQVDSSVVSVLREHLRIRKHLKIISHRFRVFILLALIIVTVSQFAALLNTTRYAAELSISESGELALVSVSLLAGLMILLRSATRITHKAQAVTCLAAKWHVCATIEILESPEADIEAPTVGVVGSQGFPCEASSSDFDDVGSEEDELDNTKIIPAYAYSTLSFQKRQALVTYFENNKAGIAVFGFMLDRTSLLTIVTIELSLVLWLLGKTIGIS